MGKILAIRDIKRGQRATPLKNVKVFEETIHTINELRKLTNQKQFAKWKETCPPIVFEQNERGELVEQEYVRRHYDYERAV